MMASPVQHLTNNHYSENDMAAHHAGEGQKTNSVSWRHIWGPLTHIVHSTANTKGIYHADGACTSLGFSERHFHADRAKFDENSTDKQLDICLSALCHHIFPRSSGRNTRYPKFKYQDEIVTFLIKSNVWAGRYHENRNKFIADIRNRMIERGIYYNFPLPEEAKLKTWSDYYSDQPWNIEALNYQLRILKNWFTTIELLSESGPIGSVAVRPILDIHSEGYTDILRDIAVASDRNSLQVFWPIVAEVAVDRVSQQAENGSNPIPGSLYRPVLRQEDIAEARKRLKDKVGHTQQYSSGFTPQPSPKITGTSSMNDKPGSSSETKPMGSSIGVRDKGASGQNPFMAKVEAKSGGTDDSSNNEGIKKGFTSLSESIQKTKSQTSEALSILVDHDERIEKIESNYADLLAKNNTDHTERFAKMEAKCNDLLDLLARNNADHTERFAKVEANYNNLLAQHSDLLSEVQSLSKSVGEGLRTLASGSGTHEGREVRLKGIAKEVANNAGVHGKSLDDTIQNALAKLQSRKRTSLLMSEDDLFGVSPSPPQKRGRVRR